MDTNSFPAPVETDMIRVHSWFFISPLRLCDSNARPVGWAKGVGCGERSDSELACRCLPSPREPHRWMAHARRKQGYWARRRPCRSLESPVPTLERGSQRAMMSTGR